MWRCRKCGYHTPIQRCADCGILSPDFPILIDGCERILVLERLEKQNMEYIDQLKKDLKDHYTRIHPGEFNTFSGALSASNAQILRKEFPGLNIEYIPNGDYYAITKKQVSYSEIPLGEPGMCNLGVCPKCNHIHVGKSMCPVSKAKTVFLKMPAFQQFAPSVHSLIALIEEEIKGLTHWDQYIYLVKDWPIHVLEQVDKIYAEAGWIVNYGNTGNLTFIKLEFPLSLVEELLNATL